MGRDKVLGLSLAILLIGFAGAFCFRNEEFVEKGFKLARAKILDEGIAQRPGPKPYIAESKSDPAQAGKPMVTLGGIEAIEPTDPSRTAQKSGDDRSPAIQSESISPVETDSQAPPIDQFVSAQKDRSATAPVSTAKDRGPTTSTANIVEKPLELTIRPRPLPRSDASAFAPPDSLLEDSMTWQHPADGRDGCPAMTSREPERSDTSPRIASNISPATRTYTVRRGDTLSKIAQHFLGDSNRYREIFEANRDQLQSPNARLRVGMTLRIPAERPRTKRPASSTVSQSKPARTNNSAGASSPTRQVPARPISRTRELSKPQPDDNPPPASSSVDELQESTGKPRFVPVTQGPFWRSQGASSSANPRSRNLSQRAPAVRREDGTTDRDTSHKAGDDASDESSTPPSPKPEAGSSTMGSDESEGM
jgi:nucleoid-associated protein YgaU